MPAPENRPTPAVTLSAVAARVEDLRKEIVGLKTQENAAHGALYKLLEDVKAELVAANEDRVEMRGQIATHQRRIDGLERDLSSATA